MRDACCADCRCDQPNNWRSQHISLIDLKEVEIQRFRGEDHEVDLLKVLLRCATVLERVTLRFSRKFSPGDRAGMEIEGVLKAYPSVKCNIYQQYGGKPDEREQDAALGINMMWFRLQTVIVET